MKKFFLISGIVLVVLIAAISAVPFLFKDKIVAKVKSAINENVNAKVDFDDSLVFTLSDGKVINVGEVKGEKGEKGERGAAGLSGAGSSTGFYNADGGFYNSIYGGTTALDGGSP